MKIYVIAACIITSCYYSFWLGGTISPFIPFNTGLLGVLIAALGLLFFPVNNKRSISVIFFSIITVSIVFTGSRTGLLSWLTGIFILLLLNQHLFKYRLRKFLISFAIIIICLFTISAFLFKPDSTKGRWFIWQNCFAVIQQNWATGTGLGQFRIAYNNQQANWFLQNGFQHKKTMLADTVYYAFNEWLQLAVEIGLPLTFIVLAVILFVLIRAIQNIMKSDNSCTDQKVVAAFTALLFSSFFSYPFSYLPTLLLFVLLFIWVLKISKFPFIDNRSVLIMRIAVISIFVLAALFLSIQFYARVQWKNATELFCVGYKKLALIKMKKAYPVLQTNGDYLFSIAAIYSSLNKVDSALFFLEKSALIKNDYELHRKFGQLYMETGKRVLAEKHFLKAVYMVPNRFRSREMLVDFYIQTQQYGKAVYWAKESLLLPVKIQSSIVSNIRMRFKGLISSGKW